MRTAAASMTSGASERPTMTLPCNGGYRSYERRIAAQAHPHCCHHQQRCLRIDGGGNAWQSLCARRSHRSACDQLSCVRCEPSPNAGCLRCELRVGTSGPPQRIAASPQRVSSGRPFPGPKVAFDLPPNRPTTQTGATRRDPRANADAYSDDVRSISDGSLERELCSCSVRLLFGGLK